MAETSLGAWSPLDRQKVSPGWTTPVKLPKRQGEGYAEGNPRRTYLEYAWMPMVPAPLFIVTSSRTGIAMGDGLR